MPASPVARTTTDWQRVATLLAHRLISSGQLEAACTTLDALAAWERQEGAKWAPGQAADAAASVALVQAYGDAVALLRDEDAANPFMRPRTTVAG